MNLSDDVYPWPRNGDDPFALHSGWTRTACLNFFGRDEPWTFYADGYKLAADTLVAQVETTGRDHDKLVYPILFNYRQYIELALKGIIRDARRLLGEAGGAPHGHVLTDLWNTARPLLFELAPATDDLENVGWCVKRFADIDPTSQGFRYPITTSGPPSLSADLKHIDLSQVRDVVERLGGFFGAAEMHIAVCLDYKSETLAAEYDVRV